MSTTVTIKPDPEGTEFDPNQSVTLKAVVDPEDPAATFSWSYVGKDDRPADVGASNQLLRDPVKAHTGQYTVKVKRADGTEVGSQPFELKLKSVTPGGETPQDGTKPQETPSTWHGRTVLVSMVAIAVVGIVLTWLANDRLGSLLSTVTEQRLRVAVWFAGTLALFGLAVVLVGVFMALVEWRGRFVDPKPKSGVESRGFTPDQFAQLVEAIGSLKGAALVLVIGVAILFAGAWVTQSAVGTPTPSPSPTPAATDPAGSPAPSGATEPAPSAEG